MSNDNGDKIILQIVQPIIENVLEDFEGEIIMKWKNLTLKRLEGQDVCIWQMVDILGRTREIDASLFLPKVDAVVIFYEIKDKTVIAEWLRAIINDSRIKNLTPIIVGCYQKGESTAKFESLFRDVDRSHIFLWRIDDQAEIVNIYQAILDQMPDPHNLHTS